VEFHGGVRVEPIFGIALGHDLLDLGSDFRWAIQDIYEHALLILPRMSVVQHHTLQGNLFPGRQANGR
jgi:hypothetical protein